MITGPAKKPGPKCLVRNAALNKTTRLNQKIMQTTHYNKIAIIQSLPKNNRPTGTRLCEDIEAVNDYYDLQLKIELHNIKTKNDFNNLLSKLANEARTAGLLPILHIETHGDEHGLQFSSGEQITWTEIKAPLTELNIQTKNNLFVTLAACKGAYLINVLGLTDRAPCCGLIGPTIDIHTCDVEHYGIFYRELLTTGDGDGAAKLLMESCPNSFYFTSVELFFKKVFKKYLVESCTKQAIKKRALKMYEESKAITKQNKIPNQMRVFKQQLSNTKKAFKIYKKRFFMIDLHPENKELFTLKYNDLSN